MLRHRATSRVFGTRPLLRVMVLMLALAGPARGDIRGETVTFASGLKSITVDYAAPARPGKYPAVLLLHGSGGLEQATGAVFRDIATTLASKGYVAIIPHYFEKTDHVLGRPIQDGEYEAWLDAVKDAMEFASTWPEVDPTRFAMIGYSMGSGLARARAVRDPRIKAVVSCSGAYPPNSPNEKLPALLILHGSKDKGTPLEFVKKYDEALTEREMPHALHIYNGMGHNFDVPRFQDAARRSVAFFDKYVKPPRLAR